MRRTAPWPALCLLAATACAVGDATGGRSVSVRDSAGISIAENSGPAVAEAEVVRDLVEEMRIGVVDGDERYLLHDVYALAEDAEGRIYVADNGSRSVRVYASDGTHLRDLGGPGSGPGEFPRMINLVWVDGDTVVAVDWQGRGRVNVYTPDGGLVTSIIPERGGPGDSLPRSMPRVGVPGRWIGSTFGDSTGTLALLADSTFELVTTILRFPIRPRYRSEGAEGSRDWPLFTVEPAMAIGPGPHITLHGGLPYEYRVHDMDGRLARIVRRDWDAVPVTETMEQRYRDLQGRFYDSLASEIGPRAREQQAEAVQRTERQLGLPRPDTVPPLGRLATGRDGSVWVQRRDLGDVALDQYRAMYSFFDNAPADASRWDVFDRDGRFVRAVELPARFLPFVVTLDTATGVYTDELGVQYVIRYRTD
jgi:hypothetical protein